jgi:GT2 family glycosyltransferase
MEALFSQMPAMRAVALRVLESEGHRDDEPRWWHPAPIKHYASQQFETTYFSGTAFAFRTAEILRIGAFPESIFQYFEEIEVAFRFMDAEGSIIYVPELAVRHHPGSRSTRWSDHRMFHHPRTLVLLTLACYPVARGAYFLLPRLANAFLIAAASNRLPVFFRAMHSAIQAAPGRLKERKPLRSSTWRHIAELRRTPRLTTLGGPTEGSATPATPPTLEHFDAAHGRRSISLKPSTS